MFFKLPGKRKAIKKLADNIQHRGRNLLKILNIYIPYPKCVNMLRKISNYEIWIFVKSTAIIAKFDRNYNSTYWHHQVWYKTGNNDEWTVKENHTKTRLLIATFHFIWDGAWIETESGEGRTGDGHFIVTNYWICIMFFLLFTLRLLSFLQAHLIAPSHTRQSWQATGTRSWSPLLLFQHICVSTDVVMVTVTFKSSKI